MKKTYFKYITFFISILLLLIGGEIITRALYTSPFIPTDERNLLFKYDRLLGWFPIENEEKEFRRSRLIKVKNNEFGFRDVSHQKKEKKRIAFVGDSFVWGYDVEQDERFTDILQTKLPDWDIINMGISGYGTDQEFILIQKWFDQFQPDIVFLLFTSDNDVGENIYNERYGYYKPYFTIKDDDLQLQGVPVPVSMRYYKKKYPLMSKSKLAEFLFKYNLEEVIRNEDPTILLIKKFKEFVLSKGSIFYLGFVNEAVTGDSCSFCEKEKIDHIFLTNSYKYETFGNHWTPKGHNFAAEKIYNFLKERQH